MYTKCNYTKKDISVFIENVHICDDVLLFMTGSLEDPV